MTQHMGMNITPKALSACPVLYAALNSAPTQTTTTGLLASAQPDEHSLFLISCIASPALNPCRNRLQGFLADGHHPVLRALAGHSDQSLTAVDIGEVQACQLRQPEPR